MERVEIMAQRPRRWHVLFVHQSAELYGSDRVLLILATTLKEGGLVWPIVVLPWSGPLHAALEAAGVEVHVAEVLKLERAALNPGGFLRTAVRALRVTRQLDAVAGHRRVAVVHSNTLAVLGGAWWAWRRGIPHVWHVHEILLKPAWLARLFPRLVGRWSHCAVANSRATEQWLLAHQPQLSDRTRVVYNALPAVPAPLPAAVAAFRRSIGATAESVVVTLAGRLNHWKGQGLLIDALAALKRRGGLAGVVVAIVGDSVPGQEYVRDQLMEQASSAGLGGIIAFVPFSQDIWPIWFGTQIAVVPSRHPESFGLVAVEAMAAAVPVVAAAHGGLLEIVEDGGTGLLFAPGDAEALANALGRLIEDSTLREALGAAGAKRQEELFSGTGQARQMEEIYGQLVAGRHG